jgi:hypothetical protein
MTVIVLEKRGAHISLEAFDFVQAVLHYSNRSIAFFISNSASAMGARLTPSSYLDDRASRRALNKWIRGLVRQFEY